MTWLRSKVFFKTSLVVLIGTLAVNLFGLLVAMADTGATCASGLRSCGSGMAVFNHIDTAIQPLYAVSFPLFLVSIAAILIAVAAKKLSRSN